MDLKELSTTLHKILKKTLTEIHVIDVENTNGTDTANKALLREKEIELKELQKEIPIYQTVYWTDSQVTLAWIRTVNKEYKTFVENRLREIRKLANPDLWRYVPTNLNPADLITRPINVSDFASDSIWFKCPNYLFENEAKWSTTPNLSSPQDIKEKN